ncbi:hypothetical protein GCWU000246_00936 [Jonquetella anthropi E3_33 E1]|nr:hypothetical protein GCWU000246_00936 [Jonquetella anthropi E3_33 E1]
MRACDRIKHKKNVVLLYLIFRLKNIFYPLKRKNILHEQLQKQH